MPRRTRRRQRLTHQGLPDATPARPRRHSQWAKQKRSALTDLDRRHHDRADYIFADHRDPRKRPIVNPASRNR